MSNSLELFHYGIKGMRWGIRRPEGDDGNVGSHPANKRTDKSDDRKKFEEIKEHSISKLSNNELKVANERMQLEKSYRELSSSSTSVSRGKKKVDNVLKYGNTINSAVSFANGPVGSAIKRFIAG